MQQHFRKPEPSNSSAETEENGSEIERDPAKSEEATGQLDAASVVEIRQESEDLRKKRRFAPITWLRDLLRRNLLEPLVRSRNAPWFDARGVFFGLLVGFGTPLGSHLVCLLLLRIILRFNFLVGIAFTWVCNPFNGALIYYGFYCLGSFLLGRPRILTFEVYRELVQLVFSRTNFWEGLSAFMALSQDFLVRWFVGAVTVALTTSVLGYAITYRIQMARWKRRARRAGIHYEKMLRDFEATTTQDKGRTAPLEGDERV